jgi:hypothetical protein
MNIDEWEKAVLNGVDEFFTDDVKNLKWKTNYVIRVTCDENASEVYSFNLSAWYLNKTFVVYMLRKQLCESVKLTFWRCRYTDHYLKPKKIGEKVFHPLGKEIEKDF